MHAQMIFLLLALMTWMPCHIWGEDPWGKDADLRWISPCSTQSVPQQPKNRKSVLVKVGEVCIGFHQKVISPADGPRSHYIPSSSQYTMDAMRTYGFFSGFLLGCDRLMRENSDPWVYRTTVDGRECTMKWDPVR